MQEWHWIVLPQFGWLLWTLGGTYHKAYRRWVWPAVVVGVLLITEVGLWHSLAAGGLVCGSAHFGYGDGKSWVWRTLVGASYGLAALPLGGSWAVLCLTAASFVGLMVLSRRWNRFSWKIVEGLTGLLQGSVIVWALNR